MPSVIVLTVFLAVLAAIAVKKWFFTTSAKLLPPGPKPLPFIGNLLDVPTSYQWKTFAEWKTRYGDLSSVRVFGQQMIIINAQEVANDLLEKRGAIYSDRPVMPMAGTLMGWDQSVVLCPYNDRFRNMRRVLHRYLGSRGQLDKMQPYHGVLEVAVQQLLVRLLREPAAFIKHLRKMAGTIALQIGYGYKVKQDGPDPLVDLVEQALKGFVAATVPGSFLVDIIPALQWLPEWLPGMAWKRKARLFKAETEATADVPYKQAKAEAISGLACHNIVSDGLNDHMTPEQEYDLKQAAASLYSGGADTTVCATSTFFLAMTLYPEVQKAAQREIDAVVGRDRLPNLDDYDKLPYVSALCIELLRWNPVGPLGIPHRAVEDNFYQGYFIPKDSLLIVNIWQILRNPEIYSDPTTFKPERFLPGVDGKEPEQDPRGIAFGFGRRVCPGGNLAEASMFLTCAMTLAAFNISTAVENGHEITPDVEFINGSVSHPVPFKCSIKPRSKGAESLILG